MASCSRGPHLTITGQLLDETSGAPVARGRVDFVRTGGAALASDSVRALTDADGNFILSVDAAVEGEVTGEIVLRNPDRAEAAVFEYRVFDLTFETLRDVGDAHVLPPWSTKPALPDLAQIFQADVLQASLRGVNVEFRRTGGVRLAGTGVFRTVTGDFGVFPLFDRIVQPLDAGDVIGDLFVEYGGFVFRDFRIRATPDFRRSANVRQIDIGPASGAGH